MNRAQKNAWFGLTNCVLAIAVFSLFFYRAVCYVPVPGINLSHQPSQWEFIIKLFLQVWPLTLFVLPAIALILLFMPRKKQSLLEPDFDELDADIQNKAIQISFISVWFLWPLALILIARKDGITGALSVPEGIFIHLGTFLVCMAIYFLTKVILYQKQTTGDAV